MTALDAPSSRNTLAKNLDSNLRDTITQLSSPSSRASQPLRPNANDAHGPAANYLNLIRISEPDCPRARRGSP